MARIYRFFTRNLLERDLEQNFGRDFNLTEVAEPEIFFQLSKVLRVKPGDEIVLLPGRLGGEDAVFYEYHYSVADVEKKVLALNPVKKSENKNELTTELGLILCLPNKPDKLELILQKAVELGTKKIILVESEFSQMKHNLRLDRLQKILTEAAEQSERALVPRLEIAGNLSKYISGLSVEEKDKVLVAMERMDNASRPNYKSVDLSSLRTGTAVHILVGPEGGFSVSEKNLIAECGLNCFSLGKRILRMETAAILSLGVAALGSSLQSGEKTI